MWPCRFLGGMRIMMTILLVEDHAVVRSGLRFYLESTGEFEVCGEADSIREATILSKTIQPDIVLLDLNLPDNEGVKGYQQIGRNFPFAKTLVLTAHVDRYTLRELIRSGLKGCYLKKSNSEELLEGLKRLYHGKYAFDPEIAEEVFELLDQKPLEAGDLTDRELKILELISEGRMNKEISDLLLLSEKTIRNMISRIYKKIGVTNRTEAAVYWIKEPR